MPYTPTNHPYIPGDPYSYDLKWLVRSQKESIAAADQAAAQAAQAVSDAASALTAAGAAATAAANASNSAGQASAQATSANAAATQAAADAAAAREAAEGAAYDYWRIVVDDNDGSVSFGSGVEPVLSYLWDALQAGKAGFEIQDAELDPLRNFYIAPDPNNRVTIDRYRGKLRYWAYKSGNIVFCNIIFEMTKSGDTYNIIFQDRTACYTATTPGIPSDEEENEAL